MSQEPKYKEQYNRMMRWYEVFKTTNFGRVHDRNSDFYQDEVYAFFMNCYHLKEWIKNDNTLPIPKPHVEKFINHETCLSLCADICNSIKHLENENRSLLDPKFAGRYYKLGATISIKYTIETKNGQMDAFELASQCIEKWKDFLKDNKLDV